LIMKSEHQEQLYPPKAWAGKYFRLGYSPALFNKKLTRGNYLTLRFLPAMI
jgi:hypothetical protein